MRRFPLPIATAALAGAALILSACGSSVPLTYHSLTRAEDAGASSSGPARMLVEILPVAIPEQVDRPELVLSAPDGKVIVLGDDQWTASLADGTRQAVADALWRHSRAIDVYRAPASNAPESIPQYRLSIRVERFTATPGQHAELAASWTARRLPRGESVTCRARAEAPLPGTTAEDAARALGAGLAELADSIAAGLDRLNRGDSAPCG